MKTTERITVSVPVEVADQLRRMAEDGEIESVSAYVSETVSQRVDREQELSRIDAEHAKRGIVITAEADAWAQRLVDDTKEWQRGRGRIV